MSVMNKFTVTGASALLYLFSGNAIAIENVNFSGFLTVGAVQSNSNITKSQDGHISDDINFEHDTRVAVQVTADINQKISMTAQLFARGQATNFDTRFDWAFLNYNVNNNLNIRAGRLKMPTFLISDYLEIGYAYPWIRAPLEVYAMNPLTTITGVDLLYRTQVGNLDVLIQPYIGSTAGSPTFVPQEAIPLAPASFGWSVGNIYEVKFNTENMIGFNVTAGTDNFSVRAGHMETKVTVNSFGVADDTATFSSIGGTADWKNIVAYSEYFEREIQGSANAAFPNQKGWYATFGYRFGKLLPHITFAKVEDNSNPTNAALDCGVMPWCGTPLAQESITLGIRYELGAGAALKAEIQTIDPTLGSASATNARGLFVTDPIDDVTLYSIAVDMVF